MISTTRTKHDEDEHDEGERDEHEHDEDEHDKDEPIRQPEWLETDPEELIEAALNIEADDGNRTPGRFLATVERVRAEITASREIARLYRGVVLRHLQGAAREIGLEVSLLILLLSARVDAWDIVCLAVALDAVIFAFLALALSRAARWLQDSFTQAIAYLGEPNQKCIEACKTAFSTFRAMARRLLYLGLAAHATYVGLAMAWLDYRGLEPAWWWPTLVLVLGAATNLVWAARFNSYEVLAALRAAHRGPVSVDRTESLQFLRETFGRSRFERACDMIALRTPWRTAKPESVYAFLAGVVYSTFVAASVIRLASVDSPSILAAALVGALTGWLASMLIGIARDSVMRGA